MTSKGSEDLFFFLGDLLGATRGSVTHAHPRVPDKHEQVMELRSDLRNDPELRSRLTDHLFHYFGPHIVTESQLRCWNTVSITNRNSKQTKQKTLSRKTCAHKTFAHDAVRIARRHGVSELRGTTGSRAEERQPACALLLAWEL